MPRPVHEAIYRSQPDEHAFRATKIEGSIPTALAGTFLRSGPGLMELGEHDLSFFDGHALIAGITFADGAATFRSRFVRTPLYEKETRARAVLQRRVFTNHPSRWSNLFALAFGNSAMHDVYAWGEGKDLRVVAGNDPGHFALDPRTLATTGPETWGGAVAKGCDTAPMPYRDPHTGRLVGWIKKNGGAKPDALKFVELDGHFRVAAETPFHPLAAPAALVHDQRATAKWYVTVEQSLRLSAGSAIWGAKTVYESLATPPGATATILLVPREGGGPMIRVPLPAGSEIAFHVINAFDEGDRVVVDLVTYGGRIDFSAAAPARLREKKGYVVKDGPRPTPTRFVVDPAAAKIVESRALGDVPGEAPEVSDDVMGKAYRYAYVPTLSPEGEAPDRHAYFTFGSIAKIDVDRGAVTRWSAGADAVVSPPAFVAREGASEEDDGWLLAWVLREGGASVAILDAKDLAKGPLATIDLGIHLPGVSHVRFAPDVHLEA